MENKEIRRKNMLALAGEFGTLRALGDRTETPPAYLSQVKNRAKDRGMGDEVARRFEEKLGKPRGWMDVDHSSPGTALGDDKNLMQLIDLYGQLSDDGKAKLLSEANWLHNAEYPSRSPSNPFPMIGTPQTAQEVQPTYKPHKSRK